MPPLQNIKQDSMNAASQGGSALAKYVASLIDQSLSWKVHYS